MKNEKDFNTILKNHIFKVEKSVSGYAKTAVSDFHIAQALEEFHHELNELQDDLEQIYFDKDKDVMYDVLTKTLHYYLHDISLKDKFRDFFEIADDYLIVLDQIMKSQQ